MQSLDANSVACVLIDPPYCSGGFSETERRSAKGQGLRNKTIRAEGWFDNDNMGTGGLLWLLRRVAIESSRVLVDGGWFLMFCDWRLFPMLQPAIESAGLRYRALVVWDKELIVVV